MLPRNRDSGRLLLAERGRLRRLLDDDERRGFNSKAIGIRDDYIGQTKAYETYARIKSIFNYASSA